MEKVTDMQAGAQPAGEAVTDGIPWYLPLVGEEELALVAECIRSNYVNMGPRTAQFEARVAELLGVRHAFATTSGTAAIGLAVMASGAGPGDEVIAPALTFIGTISAIRLAGATPVLADIRRADFNIDVDSVLSRLSPRTRVVMPVHINGRAAPLDELKQALAKVGREDVVILEDAAEAFYSRTASGYLGSVGLCGATSFAPTKIITTGQGGMVFTRNDAVAEKITRLRDQGRIVHNSDSHDTTGYNFKFTDLQASVGLAQLGKLPERVRRFGEIAMRYESALRPIERIRMVPWKPGEVPLWTEIVCRERDDLHRFLLARGITCRPFWTPVHLQPPYRRPAEELPNACWAHAQAMWLPCGPTLTEAQQERVIRAIRQYFEQA